MKNIILSITCLVIFAGCTTTKKKSLAYPVTGTIERLDPALDSLIMKEAKIEIIATGLDWSEGPLWIEKEKMLLFSDVPRDTIFKWTESGGKEVYLTPSGYTDTIKRAGEKGSNGLLLNAKGNLVLCQCGNRQMARMEAPLNDPKPLYTPLAARYGGNRFSSPNDAVYNAAGELFFTDPPYGLESQSDNDPKKEMKWNGVYKVKTNGEVILLTDSIPRPNGIALLPGDKQLIIACSDPAKPNWYIYDINGDSLTNGRIFHSTLNALTNVKGLPDGMKVTRSGIIYASGPGGIWIFNREAKLLGRIRVEESASNCALSADEKTLYITNDMNILRVKLRD
jgi:gluconolactonase